MAPTQSSALVRADEFDHDERLRLSRSWASVLNMAANNGVTLSGEQLSELASDASKLFWLLVHKEYETRSPPRSKQRTALQLQSEWEEIRPSLTDFLKLFVHKWTESRYLDSDVGTCRREALHWAMTEFLESTGSYFKFMDIASKLTFHEKFWTVLSPMLLKEKDTSGSEERQLTRGVVRQRVEEEDEMVDRRVRRRVNSVQLLLPPQPIVLPTASEADSKKAEVLERRLEMELMTKSEEGLSSDAVEYLRLQRQEILGNLSQKRGLSGQPGTIPDAGAKSDTNGGHDDTGDTQSDRKENTGETNTEAINDTKDQEKDAPIASFESSSPRIARRNSL